MNKFYFQAQQHASWYENTKEGNISHVSSGPDHPLQPRSRYKNVPLPDVFTRLIHFDQVTRRGEQIMRYTNDHELHPLKSGTTLLKNRVIFDTRTGFLGLGPRWTQAGDCVIIFDGGRTPFIL